MRGFFVAQYSLEFIIAAATTLLLVQSVWIVALLLQRRRRRRAEERLLLREADLRTSFAELRAVGGRLVVAQEAERARLARELHDNVSQQAATLILELELLLAVPQQDVEAALPQAVDRARELAGSLRGLSHRLHPGRLQMLGLVPALRGLQRELSRPGGVIDFTHGELPTTLPQDITLSLFRVAQEALQNALKHGHPSRISMELRHVDASLVLTIEDDGAGFDVDDAFGAGLGLVSMRERLELINGTLSIHSRPRAGTSVVSVVPLRSSAPRPEPSLDAAALK
jgi:signal transduction histidine kinase